MARLTTGRIVTALAMVLLLVSCGGGDSGEDTGSAPSPPGETAADDTDEIVGGCINPLVDPAKNKVNLVTKGLAFTPATIKAPAGKPITVQYRNKDDLPHTFTVEAIGCDSNTVASGDSVQLTFDMPEGRTEFVCTIHPLMTGRLVAT